MAAKTLRAALYLRVSTTDGQTTENQRLVLARVAEHRGWEIVQSYEDVGISGAKGRDKRPALTALAGALCTSPPPWRNWMLRVLPSIQISRPSTAPARSERP